MQYNFGAREDAKKTLGFINLLLQGIMIRNIVSNEYTIHFIGIVCIVDLHCHVSMNFIV